jgi:ATP-binding cassette subfamily B protein
MPQRPKYLRRVLTLFAARRGMWACVLLASLALSLCGLVAPCITQGVLDRVLPTGNLALLGQLLLLLLLVTVVQVGLTVWRRLTLVRLSLQIDRRALGELCAHLLSLPLPFLKGRRAGDLLGRFHDHGHVRHLLAGGIIRVSIDAVMIVLYGAVMIAYSPRLALLVLALAAVFAGYTLWLSPVLKGQHRRLLDDSALQEAQLVEALVGADLVKALAVERAVQRRWEAAYEKTLASNYRTQKLRQILESGGAAIQFLSTAGVLGCGAALVVGGELSAGQLVAFSMYATQALVPLLGLITLWEEVQQARAALERLQEILEQEPEAACLAGYAPQATRIGGYFQVEDVSFTYGGIEAAPVLRGITFEVRPGECVALVGRSGSGKSTVARLLLGLYRPSRGHIRVDGTDLASLEPAVYRRQVGAVLQENLLVTGTIRENITFGDPHPDEGRMTEAARLVGADEFVAALPGGYDTPVGELGLTLSGGQRQRLSLARALYRDPRILILDEPTSALDGASTQTIDRNWGKIAAGRTVVLITHEPTVAWKADRILVFEEGMIVEQGRHQELLPLNGAYARLLIQRGP